MASVSEFNLSNISKTGNSVPVPQWTFDVQVIWTDDDGAHQEHSGTYRFPNVLSAAPDGYMRQKFMEMVQDIAYFNLGIMPLPEGAGK